MSNELICKKCGLNNWGYWTSSSTHQIFRYCKICRRKRADIYTQRKEQNGGKHTKREWLFKLNITERCSICNELWENIPNRPDKRYKYVWTKDHIIPLSLGGSDDISNIQAVCYRCNSGKCNRI